jgi:hypothetical protein
MPYVMSTRGGVPSDHQTRSRALHALSGQEPIPPGDAVPVEGLCAILASSGVSTEVVIDQLDRLLHRFTNAMIACEERSGAVVLHSATWGAQLPLTQPESSVAVATRTS